MTCKEADVDVAVNALLRGYQEEAGLYTVVRNLTLSQHRTLRTNRDLMRFSDLLDEKEDLLQLIDQIEEVLAPAKSAVLGSEPSDRDHRRRLAGTLDQVTDLIEEIRILESRNAGMLEMVSTASR